VPPEDGSLTPETCRGFKTQSSDCESENILSWLRYCENVLKLDKHPLCDTDRVSRLSFAGYSLQVTVFPQK
jgi:hypothetical protein